MTLFILHALIKVAQKSCRSNHFLPLPVNFFIVIYIYSQLSVISVFNILIQKQFVEVLQKLNFICINYAVKYQKSQDFSASNKYSRSLEICPLNVCKCIFIAHYFLYKEIVLVANTFFILQYKSLFFLSEKDLYQIVIRIDIFKFVEHVICQPFVQTG